jgi:hypothetical protein
VTYNPARKRSELAHSAEAQLLDLLRKAETDAYALAHGCDVGGYADLGDAVVQVDELVHSVDPRRQASNRGLKWRAHSLRRLLIESTRAPYPAPLMRSTIKGYLPSRRSVKRIHGRG